MSFGRVGKVVVVTLALSSGAVFAQEQVLSDKDKAEDAKTIVAQLEATAKAVSDKVEEARRDRDVLRLTCVNDRKTKIDELLKVASDGLSDLTAAVKEKQTEAVEHEYNKIKITRQKITQYKDEADRCIGLLAFYDSEKMQVTVTDSNKDSSDLDVLDTQQGGTTSTRPSPASPN